MFFHLRIRYVTGLPLSECPANFVWLGHHPGCRGWRSILQKKSLPASNSYDPQVAALKTRSASLATKSRSILTAH